MLINLSILMLKHINASYRSRVKEAMEIEETEKNLSDILKDVYDNTEKFDPQKHFKLIDACKLWKYEDPPFEYIAQF